mmetsp:Transcript_32700/g.106300  ORF Transcript_32700/g.106300 Transcript_32700/m.106300 type:complete len:244 (-) Transcript_32700:136-867(-)
MLWGVLLLVSTGADDVCSDVRATWNYAFRPRHVNPKPLIIGAGEGTTGTHTVAKLISDTARPARTVAHWELVYGNRSREASQAYVGLRKRLLALTPPERAHFDYDVFDAYDGVADSPIPELFPYIYRTYPQARVILSVRNASEWVDSRVRHHPTSPRPFALFDASMEIIKNRKKKDRTSRNSLNPSDSALAFAMHNMLVRCLVPPHKLLVVDVFNTPGAVLREQIRAFLMPTKQQDSKGATSE